MEGRWRRLGSWIVALAICLVGLAFNPASANAADCTWNGGSGEWNSATNWSCNEAPTALMLNRLDAESPLPSWPLMLALVGLALVTLAGLARRASRRIRA